MGWKIVGYGTALKRASVFFERENDPTKTITIHGPIEQQDDIAKAAKAFLAALNK